MKKASTIKLRDLRIMKFGGTSVGDANCIRRAAEIVRSAVCDSDLVVVVSAMGGVTNQLLEAAACWEGGDRDAHARTAIDDARRSIRALAAGGGARLDRVSGKPGAGAVAHQMRVVLTLRVAPIHQARMRGTPSMRGYGISERNAGQATGRRFF